MPEDKKALHFFLEHDANPNGVYLVEVWLNGDCIRGGIFTKRYLAEAWLEKNPDGAGLIVPFVLDRPEWGQDEAYPKGVMIV
jgi:hypothetical protein